MVIRRSTRVFVAVLGFAWALSACANGPQGTAESDTFKVTMVVGQTGIFQNTAGAGIAGMQAAAEVVNKAGGIGGRQVEVTIVDNQSDGSKAPGLVQAAIDGGRADMLSVGVTSGEVLPAAPLSTRNKVLMMTMGSSPLLNKPADYPYLFSTSSKPSRILALAPSTMAERGVKRVAAILPSDAFGDGESAYLTKAYADVGIKYDEQRFKTTDVDQSAVFLRALRGQPDAIFLDGAGSAVPQLLEARKRVNATSVPTMLGFSISASDVTSLADAEALKNTEILIYAIQDAGSAASDKPQFATFMDAVKAKGVNQAITVYALAFDQLMLVQAAVAQADSTAPADVAKALENLNKTDNQTWVTFGEYGYTAQDHFPAGAKEDYGLIKPAKVVGGQFTP